MDAGDLLRLAWEADHDGRAKLRDSLLTMAVLESTPHDAWAERCRARLIKDRPDHFLSQFPSVKSALADPRVIAARDRLRAKYPKGRVEWLLLGANASRGPFLGRPESIDAMIEDLTGIHASEVEVEAEVVENVRIDLPQPSRGPLARQKAPQAARVSIGYPSFGSDRKSLHSGAEVVPEPPSDWDGSTTSPQHQAEEFVRFYASVLLGIAFLLASVQPEASTRSRNLI